jgi:filamentous hemagglutinin family protein
MVTVTNIMKKRSLRRGIIYFLTCNLILNTWLPAVLAEVVLQPDGLINGNITVSPLTDGVQNMTASDGAIGHFSSFDIAAGNAVYCVQPNSSANALFRIFSGDGTQIYGSFEANGNIFLIDPAGILFGAGSQINVNGLVASCLDISNQDFLDGNYRFVAGGGDVGAVINNDTITAAEGVALIGRKILNTGTIRTGTGGLVVMAAGDEVVLGQPGSDVIVRMDSVTVSGEGDGDVINDGLIESKAGTVVLAAGDMFSTALELDRVSGGIGRIEQNGTIDTDGTSGDGGRIMLTAADEVILSADSLTKANAGTTGDSGLVVVHSRGQTTVEAGAKIEAMGGYVPYDITDDFDDVVDTSVEIGGDYVNFAGDVDASASFGKRGKIIIDALDMTIADGYKPDAPADNTVYEKWIEQQSYASTDVELVAHSKTAGNIIAEPISDGVIEGGSGDIVLRTKYDTGGIEFMPGPNGERTAIHTTEGGNIYMLAGGDDPDTTDVIEGGIAVGDIISFVPQHATAEWIVEPGKIRLLTTNYGGITTGQLSVDGGSYDEISVIASGDLLINGDVTTYAHQVDEDLEVGQARTCLVSEHGDVEINGVVTVEAHAKYESTADIHIDAARDVRIDLGGGQILATALTSAEGSANASVLIHAGKETEPAEKGSITITNPKHADKAIYLRAQTQGSKAEIYSDGKAPADIEVTDGESRAKLELDEKHTDDCPDCPTPPGLDTPLPPITVPDKATTHMGDSVTANVLDNDSLPQGGELTAHVMDDPEHGVLVDFDPETGEYTYQPDEGFVGEDTFTYITTDGELFSETATVTITVNNTLPDLGNDTATTHMGDTVSNINVLANDADPDGDAFAIDSFVYQGEGTLVKNEDGTFTYTPPEGFVGSDSFTYTTSDGQDGVSSEPATAVITVTNALPVLADDTATTHMGDPVSNINVLANDVDPDDDVFAVDSFLYEGSGTLIQNEDGTFTYTPPAGFVGEDSFTYTTNDSQIGVSSESAMVTISVINALPTLADDTATTEQNITVTINVLANDFDPDGDPLSVGGFTYEGGGTLVLNDDGTFSFTPEPGFAGQDSFTYSAADPEAGAELALANVIITINPAPVVAIPFIAPAPGLERIEFDVSGCPALVKWAAAELGIDERVMQIWAVNTLASSQDIQPCDACEKLKNVAAVLRDDGGTRLAALAQVIGEYASSTAPPTPEQMASVADVISRNARANNHYAAAGEYVDAIVAYVGILNNDLAFSQEESIMFAVDKYVAPLAENQGAGLAVYIAARLVAVGGS